MGAPQSRRLRLYGPICCLLSAAVTFGCGRSSTAHLEPPPSKPLSAAEEKLLGDLEATPASDRQHFMLQHRGEIIGFARTNKTFGDRLNQIAGAK